MEIMIKNIIFVKWIQVRIFTGSISSTIIVCLTTTWKSYIIRIFIDHILIYIFIYNSETNKKYYSRKISWINLYNYLVEVIVFTEYTFLTWVAHYSRSILALSNTELIKCESMSCKWVNIGYSLTPSERKCYINL